MITKKKTWLMILSVMILMMYLNLSDCVSRRRQVDRRWDKGLYRGRDRAVTSTRTVTSTSTACPSSCTCRHRTVRCDKGTRMVFPKIPKGVRQL